MAKRFSLRKINNLLIILLMLLVAFNFYETMKLRDKLKEQPTPQPTPAAPEQPKTPVDVTIISEKSCASCTNISRIVEQIKAAGVTIKSQKSIESSSAEGKQLINKYEIKIIPAMILSNEIKDYSEITGFWAQIGSVEGDGSYVTRAVSPPYVNLTTGKTNGLVELIVLTDNSCKSCYNTSEHINILKSMGITLAKTTYTDTASTEGKQLINKYRITAAPTIILSADAKYYGSIQSAWSAVGTIETDGTHIFRNFTAWEGEQTYRDLTTGKAVTG